MLRFDLYFIFFLIVAAILLMMDLDKRSKHPPFAPSQEKIFLPLDVQPNRIVRIILPTGGSGLYQDADIYHNLIPNSYIILVDRSSPETHPEAQKYADINLYLEAIFASKTCFPAKEQWLMVNQEFFFPQYAYHANVLLAKTRYAENLLRAYVKKLGLPTQVVYVGHTSFPHQEISVNKDRHLFVHFAGKSKFKATHDVITMWQQNNGFRHLVPDSRLIITCNSGCIQTIEDILHCFNQEEDVWTDTKTGLSIYKYLSKEDLDNIRKEAGVFLCPSTVEGYGHYISEGTANRSVVMTSDFPPMNELVPITPFLIPVKRVFNSWKVFDPTGIASSFINLYLPGSQACECNFDLLANLIKKYLLLPTTKQDELAKLNYDHYLKCQDEFKSLLTEFLKKAIIVSR